ncbi:DUF421 domain-containing protein [Cytobacillus sp. FJAT-54145]|uniref:DUF421 domain-containing protein n=1 Tax=Cytobacillus spartinae TaxID=3299023 RepID=A0ABW6KCX0_9BACI
MPGWVDVVLRSFLFIIVLFFLTKMLGKKQIAQLSFFEYVAGITIGTIAGEVVTGLESNILYGLIGVSIFAGVTVLTDILSLKNKRFREFIEGKSTIVIKDGKILEENLQKERYSVEELTSLLRQKNIFKTADVEFALLEPRGDISVFLKRESQPLTPKDVQLNMPNEKAPISVIMDGKILNDALNATGQTSKWLDMELDKLGVSIDNVYLAQIDSYGELTIDVYDDMLKVPSPQERPLLMAMLKKCQADLEVFALSTENQSAKNMYNKNADKMNDVIKKLSPYLTN